jgi:hypothetical protein
MIFLSTTRGAEFMALGVWDLVPLNVLLLEAFRVGFTGISRSSPRHLPISSPERGVGSRYRVSSGDLVSDDLQVISGSCVIARPPFAPLSACASVDEGDPILAGSRVIAGEVEGEVTAPGRRSIVYLHENSAKTTYRYSPGLSTEWESVAAFAILCIAAGAAIFWSEQSVNAFVVSRVATAVLVCAQGILVWKVIRGCRDRIAWKEWARGVWFATFAGAEKLSKATRLLWCAHPNQPIGRPEVISVELFDDRVDRVALLQVMFDLASRGQSHWLTVLGEYCAGVLGSQLRVTRILDIREYEGGQVSARLQGVDFSLGDEAFLLARGVQLQGNETGLDEGMKRGDRILLLALNRDVIGRVVMRWDTTEQLGRLPQRGSFERVESLELPEPSVTALREKDLADTVVILPHGVVRPSSDEQGRAAVYGVARMLGDSDPTRRWDDDIEIWSPDPIAALAASRMALGRSVARYHLATRFTAVAACGIFAGALVGWIPAPFVSLAFLGALFLFSGRKVRAR